jgi:hypothetical protein
VTFAPTTLFTPLVYTGAVVETAVFNSDLGVTVTDYLLPQLTDYFPPGDPFGQCTTATLVTPAITATSPAAAKLRVRQNGQGLTVGGSKINPLPQAPNTIDRRGVVFQFGSTSTVTATAESAVQQSGTSAPAQNTQGNQAPSASDSPTPAAPNTQPADTAASTAPGVQSTQQTQPGGTPSSSEPPSPVVPATDSSAGAQPTQTPFLTIFPTAPTSVAPGGTPSLTATVFYSQILAPETQSALNQLSSLSEEAATYTGNDPGGFVCSVLGCSQDPTGGVVFTNAGNSSSGGMGGETTLASDASDGGATTMATVTAPGAAARGREVNAAWVAPVVAVVGGLFV